VGPPCSTDRVLWACGAGLHGQLGLVDTVCRLVPARVGEEEAFGPSKVLTITCGHNHSMAVTEEGGPVLIDRNPLHSLLASNKTLSPRNKMFLLIISPCRLLRNVDPSDTRWDLSIAVGRHEFWRRRTALAPSSPAPACRGSRCASGCLVLQGSVPSSVTGLTACAFSIPRALFEQQSTRVPGLAPSGSSSVTVRLGSAASKCPRCKRVLPHVVPVACKQPSAMCFGSARSK